MKSPIMVEEKRCLISKILPLFMRFGIKSLTMDDIAKMLGVSKKTLYKTVPNKDVLVEECLGEMLDKQDEEINEIVKSDKSAIEDHFNISALILQSIKEVHPSVFFDLEKYYPTIFRKVFDSRASRTQDVLLVNLKKGIKEGLYRPEINSEYIVRFYITIMNGLFDPAVFQVDKTDFKEGYKEVVMFYMHAIVTEKGKKIIEQKEKELLKYLIPTI